MRAGQGQVVGVVGPSGSGKSTLTKLVQRLNVPESGRVLVDGVDLAGAEAPAPRLHPNLAEVYRARIAGLARVLAAEDGAEAGEVVRGLVEAIRLIPEGERLRIEIRGELGAIPRLAEGARNAKGADLAIGALAEQIKMDAGTRIGLCRMVLGRGSGSGRLAGRGAEAAKPFRARRGAADGQAGPVRSGA